MNQSPEHIPELNTQETKSSHMPLLVGGLVCIVVLVSVYFYWFSPVGQDLFSKDEGGTVTEQSEEISHAEILTDAYEQNDLFKQGYSAELSGSYEEAVRFYKEAMEAETDPIVKSHIHYRLARSMEHVDVFEAIKYYKEVIADETYPDGQKAYAVVWMTLMISRYATDDSVKNAILADENYIQFASPDTQEVFLNLYHYSLGFGSTGIAEFHVARQELRKLQDMSSELTAEEIEETLDEIRVLAAAGEDYIEANRQHPRNSEFVPRVLREKARFYGEFARFGDSEALANYDIFFEEAIEANILSGLDGAVRFDYFSYAYLVEGESSFARTQRHIDHVLDNLDRYYGMKRYFENEKNDVYGKKSLFIQLAEANPTFNTYLRTEAEWTDADFE